MAQFDVAKAVVNYRNRFLKSVMHDLLVKYGKRDILYIIAECISEIEPSNPLLITTEDDGSRWVQLEDYMYLQGNLSKAGACPDCGGSGLHNDGCPEIEAFRKMCPENTSGLTKRAADETICTCSHDAYENVVNPGHCMACGKPFRR